jgi:hypothetical protein
MPNLKEWESRRANRPILRIFASAATLCGLNGVGPEKNNGSARNGQWKPESQSAWKSFFVRSKDCQETNFGHRHKVCFEFQGRKRRLESLIGESIRRWRQW